ncbi:MAG: Gfo/Idh/MocA family oxidoreductase [bacterium]|nr:Gfo/Idh/MocA family oxidoreductase [bacterium]
MAQKNKLGWGLIGAGMIAGHFREGIAACPDAKLIAISNYNEEKGKKFAAESGGIKYYKDYEKMVADPDVDIVGICTPSGMHADNVIAAAQAGKHSLCEKPLDVTQEKMTRMIDECRRADVKLGAVFQSRTREETIQVRQAIGNGELGPLVLGDAFLKGYRSQAYYNSAGWRGTWEHDGGGALMNQGVHGVDLLLWLMNDEVESVFARAEHKVRDIEVEDTAVANLKYKSGAFGTIVGTTSCNPGEASRTELHGKRGTITLSGTKITRWATTSEEDGRAQDKFEPKQIAAHGNVGAASAVAPGHDWLINDMTQAVKENREPYIPGESARKAVDLILAIYESARTGEEIFLNK